jgi:hypothetical protein
LSVKKLEKVTNDIKVGKLIMPLYRDLIETTRKTGLVDLSLLNKCSLSTREKFLSEVSFWCIYSKGNLENLGKKDKEIKETN